MTEPSVLGVVVAFNPSPSLSALVDVLRSDGLPVLVVDNGSTAGLEHLARADALGATVERLGDNRGVSGALAIALDRATAYEWILTFDQDSSIQRGFAADLATSEAAGNPRVAVVAPVVVDAGTGREIQSAPTKPEHVGRSLVITSGSLNRVRALREVGGFQVGLFIDMVDYDVCLRLIRGGWQVRVDPQVTMTHSLGALREHEGPAGVRLRSSHHNADRLYYRYRNAVILARQGVLAINPAWTARLAVGLLAAPVKVALIEADRKAKFRAVAHGLRDGWQGKVGARHG